MATTPYSDLTTQEILSAHISGLSHSIKKIEGILNMKTAQKSFTLLPVINQSDLALRYRIYEGEQRNWISFTVTRNGESIPADEYEAQNAFGVIIFKSPQLQTDKIVVNVTYIIAESTTIINHANSISSLQTKTVSHDTSIASLTSGLDSLTDTVNNLPTPGSGSGGEVTNESLGHFDLAKDIFSNTKPHYGGDPGPITAVSVLMASSAIDAYPMIIKEPVTISKMSVTFSENSTTANNLMGIYSNEEGTIYPNQRLAGTAVFRHGTVAEEIATVNLTSAITLQPGIYWLARWHNDGVRLEGHVFDPGRFISINPPVDRMNGTDSGKFKLAIGVRTGSVGAITTLPTSFPALGTSGANYLLRTEIGTMKALK